MNLVVLKGNIGQDPEIKTFDWGKVAKFSLATSESYKNKSGERVTETDWHNLVFKGVVCDTIEKFLHKGDQVAITGKIKTRSYEDKNKVTHYVTEIICDSFEFCGTKQKEEAGSAYKEAIVNKSKEQADNDDLSDLPF